jgi:lysophospholipase L1-like esterase
MIMLRSLLVLTLTTLMTGAASAADLPAGARYVSMGSSYAAGPGVGARDPDSGACARSQSNFARQVAAQQHLDLVDVACSGATTANILQHGQHGFPAQIEAVTPGTRLVTILIGGNDVDYVGNLGGMTCQDTGGEHCKIVPDAEVDRRLATLPDSLHQVIGAVQSRAPGARIVLVGYLPAIPAAGAAVCAALPLTAADAATMRSVAVRLAQAVGGAASAAGIDVIRASMIGRGHDACSSDPYIAGAHPARNDGWAAPVPYHPNQQGMDQIAAAIEAVLSR